ncbi:MAG: flagellar hook-length control protein FliK [Lachnospiraceae bacterium]|nr:flagellar hook-length control protein FliK [Lachnospiraceae bacterium]
MAKINDVRFASATALQGMAPQGTAASEGSGFSEIMKQAQEAGEQSEKDLMNLTSGLGNDRKDVSKAEESSVKETSSTKVERKQPAAETKTTDKQDTKEVSDKNNVDTKNDTVEKEISDEEIGQIAEVLTQIIADRLQIPAQEVADVIGELDLSVSDLMQSGNMADLYAALENVDQADIVMSEEMTDLVTSLSAEVGKSLEDAAADLGISVEELTDAIKAQAAEAAETTVPVSFTETVEKVEQPVVQAPVAETVKVERDTKDTGIEAEAEPVDKAAQAPAAETVAKPEESGDKQDTRGGRDTKSSRQNTQSADLSQQTVKEPAAQNAEVRPVADRLEESFDAQKTRQIIDQIAEYAKVNQSEKLTGIEMMLNPANLGTIRLQLESDNGVIRGQLTASDEAVRAALESQLGMLRDALVEQGMKVDAIEVAVAGHQLEENLEQDARQQEQRSEEQADSVKGLRSSRRILDLNELPDEEQEQMSDAERLEVEMMRMGGNRLNFQA